MKVLIYDAIGRVIVDKDIDVQEGYNSFQFPMNVANSIYFVKLVNAKDELIQTQKVVISE